MVTLDLVDDIAPDAVGRKELFCHEG